ncbi:MAG: hypothetical protein AAB091_07350 [Elusimicrobiota bacterium]
MPAQDETGQPSVSLPITHKIKMKPNILLGTGWELVDQAEKGHELFLQLVDMEKGAAWHLLHGGTPAAIRISPHSRRAEGNSCIAKKRAQLFFLGETGIERLRWDAGSIDTLIPIDIDKHEVRGLQISADGDALYFGARQRSLPLSQALNMTRMPANDMPRELFRLDLRSASSVPEKCGEIPANIYLLAFNLRRMEILGITGERELLQAALLSGKWRPIKKLNRIAQGIESIPDGGFFLWGFDDDNDSGIFMFNESGEEIRKISDVGHDPASPPLGRDIAFLTNNGIWITQVGERPSSVLQINPAPTTRAGGAHRRIAWCDCGRHFAVTIDYAHIESPTPWRLVVADLNRKKVFLHPFSPIDFHWKDCGREPTI